MFCLPFLVLFGWIAVIFAQELTLAGTGADENYNEIDKPLLLKTRRQDCACVNVPTDYLYEENLEKEDPLQKVDGQEVNYDCSCNLPSNVQRQQQELQTILEKVVSTQKQQCECSEAVAYISTPKFRLRRLKKSVRRSSRVKARAPVQQQQWECVCTLKTGEPSIAGSSPLAYSAPLAQTSGVASTSSHILRDSTAKSSKFSNVYRPAVVFQDATNNYASVGRKSVVSTTYRTGNSNLPQQRKLQDTQQTNHKSDYSFVSDDNIPPSPPPDASSSDQILHPFTGYSTSWIDHLHLHTNPKNNGGINTDAKSFDSFPATKQYISGQSTTTYTNAQFPAKSATVYYSGQPARYDSFNKASGSSVEQDPNCSMLLYKTWRFIQWPKYSSSNCRCVDNCKQFSDAKCCIDDIKLQDDDLARNSKACSNVDFLVELLQKLREQLEG
uniref:Uncharacterized protein n=1 Tax=Ditylenchus dipsaci TaxID=166011 RepID=A0A915DW07_9BILA